MFQDGTKYKKPTHLPAPQYISLLMDWVESQINDENVKKRQFFLDLYHLIFFILVVSSHNRHTLSQNVPAPMQENPNTSLQGLCPRVRASFRQNHEYRGRAPCQYLLQAFLLLCHRVRSYQRKRVCPSSGDDSQNMHGYHCTAHTNR